MSKNYIYWRGGSLSFGKLTMAATDLELVDIDPKDPFDFNGGALEQSARRRIFEDHERFRGLKAHMPDYNDLDAADHRQALKSASPQRQHIRRSSVGCVRVSAALLRRLAHSLCLRALA